VEQKNSPIPRSGMGGFGLAQCGGAIEAIAKVVPAGSQVE